MALSIDQKRLKATKFPPEFDRKVDIEKVNIDLMKKWIAQKITDILGDEDDIVVETCYNLVEQSQFPKIKEIQIQLTGFLNKDTAAFCKELWDLMLSAQDSPMGVPKEMLEAKKLELQQEQIVEIEEIAVAVAEDAEVASVETVETVETVEVSAEIEEVGEAETSTVGQHVEIRDRHLQDADHHLAASVTSMYQAGAAVEGEIVAQARETAVAPPQAAAPGPHRLVVPAAHLRQIVHARLHDAEDVHFQVIVRGLHHAGQDVLPLHDASDEVGDGTSRGLQAVTAGGYPGINHVLLPLKRKRAHQRPGCQGRDPAPRRAAAAAQDRAVHGL
ncbi:hypothetical protein EKO04_002174 [Ascochyta lentis]|uniref:PWI domain-containing protein n=1 Tax=Ascochyta lentis TaxID=205686 RepID=A0A8H7J9V7_9PLEO|nr:hypothetical protein EKO04_002174 [Ascochyta lentis]